MKPDIWGPHAWIFLHSIALDYPETPTELEKMNMKNFINSMGEVLPCKKCRLNFKKHLQTYPLTESIFNNKQNLIKWFIDIHNSVNEMTFKNKLSYEEALKNILNKYDKNNNMMIIILLLAIVIITIIVILFNIFIKQ